MGVHEPKGRKKRSRRVMTEAEARVIITALQVAVSLAELAAIVLR